MSTTSIVIFRPGPRARTMTRAQAPRPLGKAQDRDRLGLALPQRPDTVSRDLPRPQGDRSPSRLLGCLGRAVTLRYSALMAR